MATDVIGRPASRSMLSDIPGGGGLPLLGHTPAFLRDPLALYARFREEHGPVCKMHAFGRWIVVLHGADALQMVLMDRDKNFSSFHGWVVLHRLFPNGLMLRDFDDHRTHRRIMLAAFRPAPLADYVDRMNERISAVLDDWPVERAFPFYRAVKELTLDLAASVFLGLDIGPQAKRINRAFVNELNASTAVVRRPVAGNAMWRGVRARAVMLDFFRELVAARPDGVDMVSQLCRARSEDGAFFADEEIVDHLNFLLMAAHDTTTSALTTMTWALAEHPQWQDVLRAEAEGIGGDRISYDEMEKAERTERVFKEALRLRPPVPFIPRYALESFDYAGCAVPGRTHVSISPGLVARDPDLWTDPLVFDPDRFAPERAEDQRHRFAWSPFGGGAHKCIGMHFATLQVKALTAQLLRRFRLELPEGYEVRWRHLPIPKPKDDLPVILRRA